MSDLPSATKFWDAEVVERRHSEWMGCLEVREYLNTLIGGHVGAWPFEWLLQHLGGTRLPRALSIGCGTGALERDLLHRGISDRVDAFDGSLGSLVLAREEARSVGMLDRLHYFAADFNEPFLPRGVYDAVFFHHSLHHVGKLEKLLPAVMHALKPDGYLYLDEFVGPSRHYWNDERFASQRALYHELVPPEARKVELLPTPVVYEDPSEAIRSGEILEQIRIGFDVEAQVGYGGNILSVIFPAVEWEYAPPDLVTRLIKAEEEWLAHGEPHYLMLVLARPKRGLAKWIASARYVAKRIVLRFFR
ncbi:MAG TPA: class I SAM-dependent methyltransferase [Thermoanaerobaculia bacterium]|nr:class I SAM-dependent methyltransferase [Thermoanaerobaculia bacterium]